MNPPRPCWSLAHRFRVALALPVLGIGALLGGCAQSSQFADEGIGQAQTLPVNSLQVKWSALLDTQSGPVTRIFAKDKFVFAYTESGGIYLLNRNTGEILSGSTVRVSGDSLHPPVVLSDYIVYPTNTSLEIYDKRGRLVRSKTLGYSVRSNAAGAKNFIYVGADYLGGGRLMQIDVNSEAQDHRWALMFPNAAVSAAPAVLGQIVYAAGEDGKVVAIASDSREPIWSVEGGTFITYGPVLADIAADESGVYIASTDTKLVALNRNTGKVKWQYAAAAELRATPTLTKSFVFELVPSVGMVALDKANGAFNRAPSWVAPDVKQILAEDDKYVYAVRQDNVIVALDKQDGHVVFTSKRHDLVAFATNSKEATAATTRDAAASHEVTIYAVTSGNRILALNPVLKPGQVGELVLEEKAIEPVAMAR